MNKKVIRHIFSKILSYIGYWASKSPLYTIYFNFRYLPLNQVKHLPILIYDTFVVGTPKIFIDSDTVSYGMIKIGRIGNNIFNPSKSTLTFWDKGKVNFQGTCKLSRGCHIRVQGNAILDIGDNFYSSSNLNLQCDKSIAIGRNVTIGWNVSILDTDYHKYFDITKQRYSIPSKPIVVEDNVWIGYGCSIMKGTHIAQHTIVSAGSVVSGNFMAENVVIKGNPATVARDNVMIDEQNFW